MDTTTSVEVARSAADAFTLVADFAQNPRWQGGMRACRWVSDPPTAVGSRYEQEASLLGRPILSLFDVTALKPDRSISIASISGTFPIQVTRKVEAWAPDAARSPRSFRANHLGGSRPWAR